jgi:hypothetical protein
VASQKGNSERGIDADADVFTDAIIVRSHQSGRRASEREQANPHAAYLFVEEGKGYLGKRLTLRSVKEETDVEKIQSIHRRQRPCECEEGSTQFLVYFHVDGVRPLIGTD